MWFGPRGERSVWLGQGEGCVGWAKGGEGCVGWAKGEGAVGWAKGGGVCVGWAKGERECGLGQWVGPIGAPPPLRSGSHDSKMASYSYMLSIHHIKGKKGGRGIGGHYIDCYELLL